MFDFETVKIDVTSYRVYLNQGQNLQHRMMCQILKEPSPEKQHSFLFQKQKVLVEFYRLQSIHFTLVFSCRKTSNRLNQQNAAAQAAAFRRWKRKAAERQRDLELDSERKEEEPLGGWMERVQNARVETHGAKEVSEYGGENIFCFKL